METIALFGGSFDPPHIGHLAVVEALKKLEFIDKVILMPTFLNPFKSSSHADASLRLGWLEEIFGDDEDVIVSDFEVSQNEKTPTIKTLKHLLNHYKKVYIVIGADNLASLHKWHSYEQLKQLSEFLVASRDAIEIPEGFYTLGVCENISSSQLRAQMDEEKLIQKNAKKVAQFYKENNAKQNRKDNSST